MRHDKNIKLEEQIAANRNMEGPVDKSGLSEYEPVLPLVQYGSFGKKDRGL